MGILKILGNIGKTAIKQTIGINLDQMKKGAELDSKLERKTHEITTVVSNFIVSGILLYKLIFPQKSNKSIKKEKR